MSSNSSESKADINSGSKRSLIRVRLLTCCEAKGSRLCDKMKSDGYCPTQVSMYRHKLTNITMMVRGVRSIDQSITYSLTHSHHDKITEPSPSNASPSNAPPSNAPPSNASLNALLRHLSNASPQLRLLK